MTRRQRVFDFARAVAAIRGTERGRERNMYPHARDLFAHSLGHDSANIIVDSPQDGGGAPDLVIKLDVGIRDNKNKPLMHDWVVVEVKDEPDAFKTPANRERIFNEKSKYVRLGTEYFVMIDPTRIVARPVSMRSQLRFDPAKDVELEWEGLTEERFLRELTMLRADHVAETTALRQFRAGDESQIAVVKVDLPAGEKATLSAAERERLSLAREDFLDAVRKGTRMLQHACFWALEGWSQKIGDTERDLRAFDEKWEGYDLTFDPVVIKGARKFKGKEDKDEHKKEARELAKRLRRNLAIAKLAGRGLPAYRKRVGDDDKKPFTIESANLILARILLLRFFEDHNFFGDKKYVCSGGVAALQDFMRHYGKSYAFLLKMAYQMGEKIHIDAFELTDLDWALESDDEQASRAIELTMMYLSRFDFSTVSGDILNGIYDRFLDPAQRKEMGEFYTPPSVARYIVERLGVAAGQSVFDPACGSGTFLLEAFARMTGGDVARGRAPLAKAREALATIGGNDLNPFSAMLSRIQMLWQLLPLKEDLKKEGFPDVRIAANINAVVDYEALRAGQGESGDIYGDLDAPIHDFVIGNPPYVRPERSGEFDRESAAFYAPIGGPKKNAYDLFVYKALKKWCRPPGGEAPPGKLGFVLPLSFCDNKNSGNLRKLFALGGEFAILEIVDMEAIAPAVFDAAVNPIILLAERRKPRLSDKVVIRVAGDACIVNRETREFDLGKASESRVPYRQLFSNDGSILTKLTPSHKALVDKMAACGGSIADIALPYWVGKRGNKIMRWSLALPADDASLRWERRIMLSGGAVLRRLGRRAGKGEAGLDFYKGENIRACRIEGEPSMPLKDLLPTTVSDPSLWRYQGILPPVGYAFLRITLGITVARFNPQESGFLSTATLLFPNAEWQDFPIDAAMLSCLYQFYYAVYLREGIMSHSYRSDLYPRTLRKIPWPRSLKDSADELCRLRDEYLRLCERINNRDVALSAALEDAGAVVFVDACRDKDLTIHWSDAVWEGGEIVVNAPRHDSCVPRQDDKGDWRLHPDADNADIWFSVADADIAASLVVALTVRHGETMKRAEMLDIRMPKGVAARKKFVARVKEYDAGGNGVELEEALDEVDGIVGAAFGLSGEEVAYIQRQMREDSFLSKIRPNMPFSGKKQRGLLGGLDRPDRYRGRPE